MSAPRARGRDDAPPGVAWTRLESPPPPDKRSGLTSSDDAPRYRRGSKRRPKPPKTPPGLVQPLHRSLAIARFEGKGRGYAAVAHVRASAMLLQERPLRVAGDFPSAKDAQRALAKLLVSDRRHDALLGDGASSSAATSPSSRGGGGGGGRRADADSEPSPMVDEGVDDETWNRALRRVRADAVVRVASRDEGGGVGSSPVFRVEIEIPASVAIAPRGLRGIRRAPLPPRQRVQPLVRAQRGGLRERRPRDAVLPPRDRAGGGGDGVVRRLPALAPAADAPREARARVGIPVPMRSVRRRAPERGGTPRARPGARRARVAARSAERRVPGGALGVPEPVGVRRDGVRGAVRRGGRRPRRRRERSRAGRGGLAGVDAPGRGVELELGR